MVQEGLRKRSSFSLPSVVLGNLNQWLGIAPPEIASCMTAGEWFAVSSHFLLDQLSQTTLCPS